MQYQNRLKTLFQIGSPLNAAAAFGWLVFRFTSDMLRNEPEQHLKPVIKLIEEYSKEVTK